MGTINPWNQNYPAWATQAVNAMKTLDALDAQPGGNRYDGKFHGNDLTKLFATYVGKYQSHQPGFARIIEATSGLMRYANDGNIAARKDASLPLADALLEGARAMLDGRDGNYTAIPGFKERYLAEEFVPLLRTIQGGQIPPARDQWKNFWSRFLAGCCHDLFMVSGCYCSSTDPAVCAF